MLRFHSLEIENFGPFKDKQFIEFPEDNGVSIVYGENMRGKTSLLNAIRYALFGVIRNRKYEQEDLFKYSNLESKQEGKYGFKMSLTFSSNGTNYELHRALVPKNGDYSYESDSDYDEECYIRKNSTPIGPDRLDDELEQIMPESVSRFFLFDGELLQEYEDLLRDESQMGRRISNAIERILGIPILTNARGDLNSLISAADKDLSAAALKDNKTKEIGQHLTRLAVNEKHHKEELDRLNLDYENLESNRSTIRHDISQLGDLKATLARIDSLEERINAINDDLAEKYNKVKDHMDNAWIEVIGAKIGNKRKEIDEKIKNLQNKIINEAILKHQADVITKGLSKNVCPTCEQGLSNDAIEKLQRQVENCNSNLEDNAINTFHELTHAAETLRNFESQDVSSHLKEVVSSIEALVVEREDKKNTLNFLKEEITDDKEERVRELNSKLESVTQELAIVASGIEEQQAKLDEIKDNKKELQKKLDEMSGSDLNREKQKVNIYKSLHALFESAVSKYRDELRSKVEKDATDLFKILTTEKEYKQLQINENYGLRIIHEDGHEQPVRSAGAEQVVALSLIGALQKNAPLQGPIIMDSTFNRLDNNHKDNVIKALPGLADQVLLLVHSNELSPDDARVALKGKLKSEYVLERKTARHTLLKKVREF